jgi:putative SOS response-associated peptidase YedK
MCGRYDTSHLTWKEIHAQLSGFGKVAGDASNMLQPNPDVRPTTEQLVARLEDGAFVLDKMRWGLVPFWRGGKPLKDTGKGKGDGFKLTTFNCRVESCETAATFKGAYARRRCIVPANAWYEWKGDRPPKPKFRFARADGAPLWFAGLWDRCATPDAGEVKSFTIMTGPSAGLLAGYHDRAPVVLDPEDWAVWLDPAQDAKPLMAAVRAERFVVGEATK